MNQKTIIAGILCTSLLATAAYAAGPAVQMQPIAAAVSDSAETSAAVDAPAAVPEQKVPYSIGVRAVVTDILKDNGRLSLEVKPEEGEPIILILSEETILVDQQKAVPVGAEEIKVGDTIYAYHDLIMTMSIPGQTPALAILTNLDDDSAPAVLHMPEKIQRSEDGVRVLCDNGSMWINMVEDTVFTPYRTRQVVGSDDIRIGQPFLAWYDFVFTMDPGLANAERVMILPASQETKAASLVMDGDMVIDAKMEDGTVTVPARLTAEALGLTVGYRRENGVGVVTISNGKGEISMVLGEDAYGYSAAASGMPAAGPKSYGKAPYAAPYMDGSDVTWMSAEAFELLGYEVTLSHGEITILDGNQGA